ncbi:MAG: hypothetical protein NC115_05925 [Bacteroidales bacterium]|nr:hypothetical protein [Bacteroides sp.]MCM1197529.1 hypothetical protein [Clostridium sp.]MCM1502188.1 hypothetical protein [Bacteroidales bacterium]
MASKSNKGEYSFEKVQNAYRNFLDDIVFDPDMMSDEDQKIRKLKYIINKKLLLQDRAIILLYAEYRSLRKLAAMLDVSHVTVRKMVDEVRNEIFAYLERFKDIDI